MLFGESEIHLCVRQRRKVAGAQRRPGGLPSKASRGRSPLVLPKVLKSYNCVLFASRQARAIRDAGHQSHKEQKKKAASNRRETKAAKTLAIVMGVFIVCWVPYFLCNIIDPLLNHVMSPLLIEILFWFGYMNSTFNPLVYGFFYSWFRKALKLIATGKIFQNSSSRTKLLSD
uniref:G-protein coupled receptors family 1 profile domain-containing protein n=1 Tax=Erpetoichthys calabaricus TaxID=27687 RepID=A0A8C4RHC9_ERPCA